jgi:hypothetical protein
MPSCRPFGIYFPPRWTDYPGRVLVFYQNQWTPLDILQPTLTAAHTHFCASHFSLTHPIVESCSLPTIFFDAHQI